jgi:hypothetical protein
VDLGFDLKEVLTGRIAYFDDDKRIEFFRRVVDSVRLFPGVNDVAMSYSLPLDKDGAFDPCGYVVGDLAVEMEAKLLIELFFCARFLKEAANPVHG